MRCYPAAVFVLALGCGASTEAGSALSQRSVFASAIAADPTSEAQHAIVAELPVLAVLRDGATTIVVRGDVSAARGRTIARAAASTYRDFNRRFGVTARDALPRRPVDICVFESSTAYHDAARQVFGREAFFAVGFYMPSHRLVMVDTSRGIGNLRHEMIHPLVKDWWPDVPAWVDEGLASLYGTAYMKRKSYRFLVNYRLRHLRRAAARGTLPQLDELTASTYSDVHGEHERAYYAISRYLLLYLHRQGKLISFVREMRALSPTAANHQAVVTRYVSERKFLRWALRLKRPGR